MEIKLKGKTDTLEIELMETERNFQVMIGGWILFCAYKDGNRIYAYPGRAKELGFKTVNFE